MPPYRRATKTALDVKLQFCNLNKCLRPISHSSEPIGAVLNVAKHPPSILPLLAIDFAAIRISAQPGLGRHTMRIHDGVTEKVLEHGLGIASARGLHALSMGEVARELDLSRQGLVAAFGDQENLQLAVLDQAAGLFRQTVFDTVPANLTGKVRVTALFKSWIQWSRAPRLKRGCPFVHASAEAEGLSPRVRARINEQLAEWTGVLTATIDAAKADGDFNAGLDSAQLVFELYGLYLSHHFWHWSMRDQSAQQRTLNAFERLISASSA